MGGGGVGFWAGDSDGGSSSSSSSSSSSGGGGESDDDDEKEAAICHGKAHEEGFSGDQFLDDALFRPSFNAISKQLKRDTHSMYNCLRSIQEDAEFVRRTLALYPSLAVYANLRCGLWYMPPSETGDDSFATAYFKSTDGHINHCAFSLTRLNLHVALAAAERGGCLLVDATRSSTKRFPDALSKTVPIWTMVLNRAVRAFRREGGTCPDTEAREEFWDDEALALHLPLWVADTERASIEASTELWVAQLRASGVDLAPLASTLRKPLRPLWVSQATRTPPAAGGTDALAALAFVPVILVSASAPLHWRGERRTSACGAPWAYVPGAGDDEESWANGLTPATFWAHADALLALGPGLCEKEASRLQREEPAQPGTSSTASSVSATCRSPVTPTFVLGSPVALGPPHAATAPAVWDTVDAVLNIGRTPSAGLEAEEHARSKRYLHLPPPPGSSRDKFSLQERLPRMAEFVRSHLEAGRRILIHCDDGRDACVAACVAVTLWREGDSATLPSKAAVRARLAQVASAYPLATPSRESLRQAFNFWLNNPCERRSDRQREVA